MEEKEDEDNICMICYESYTHKIRLECNHNFCHSCIKGSLLKIGEKCPLCTLKIKKKFRKYILETPEEVVTEIESVKDEQDGIWFYSGNNLGWWYYDNKTNDILEELYNLYHEGELSKSKNMVSICGYLFTFDFDSMMQINKENGAVRSITRVEKDDLDKFKENNLLKGISGIKTQ